MVGALLLLLAAVILALLMGFAKPKTIYAVSNSHLDTVWSWDLEETIGTFIPDTLNGNFELIEKYPEYQFNFEGAYRYQLMEEYYPEQFEQLKKYVASGNWNPVGSGLENGDVNTPSPEALFRNFLYGNNYFEDVVGERSQDIFLPDCFGFGFALPSIASHSNLIGFTTQKLSWGNTFPESKLPFDIGVWTGPDGNSILANINGNNYTDSYDEGMAKHMGVLNKLGKSPVGRNAVLYGSGGDRGGPPSEATVAAVSKEIEKGKFSLPALFGKGTRFGLPFSLKTLDVQFATPQQILEDAEQEVDLLPGYTGELLLYQHSTGGYTSRAMSKRWNRRGELLADAAERSLTAASWLGTREYPKAEMEKTWTNLIAHQFHDDMPGTSNSTTYLRTWNDYMVDIMQFAAEYENGAAGVASLMDTRVPAGGIPLVVNNPTATARKDTVEAVLELPSQPDFLRVFDNEGNEVASQIIAKDDTQYRISFLAEVDGLSYKTYSVQPATEPCAIAGPRIEASGGGYVMENDKYTVTINAGGDIASIIDKTIDKELLNQPIRLGLFDNSSVYWSSWELEFNDYWDKDPARYVEGTPVFEIAEDGPARVALRIERESGRAKYVQLVSLEAGGETVNIDNVVNWNERAAMLKAVFDFTSANPVAAYDLGLGVIERGNNNPGSETEHKKAEVPHQKWAALTAEDGTYGVAVLNDYKSGIDKPNDSTLRLTLIHTPAGDFTHDYVGIPAGQNVQEIGENRFSFAIYSHEGTWNQSNVQTEAEAFNQPMNAFRSAAHEGPLGANYTFGKLSSDYGVLLRAIKPAERSDEIIVRFNEGTGEEQTGVKFTLGNGIASAREVYASEEEIGPATVVDGSLAFEIGAYGVKSFALTLKAPDVDAQAKQVQRIDLAPFYNVDAYSGNEKKADGGLTTEGDTYPTELVPDTIQFAGVTYQTGSKEDGAMNAIRAEGQTIPLPAGYTALKLLAASVGGDKEADFQIAGNPVTLEIADYAENVAAWDLYDLGRSGYIKEQEPAFVATHRHTKGEDNIAASTYMFLYTLDAQGAASVTLPDDTDIIIFAATAVNEESDGLWRVMPMRDTRERGENSIMPPPEDERKYRESFVYDFEPQPVLDSKTAVLGRKVKIVEKDGAKAIKISGFDISPKNSFVYGPLQAFEQDDRMKVLPGTTLTYEYYAGNKLGRYVAVDLEFESGNLRDSGAVDQNGIRLHPTDASTEKTGEWVTVTCDLSTECLDKVIREVRIAYDHPEQIGRFNAYVRNVSIQHPTDKSADKSADVSAEKAD